LCKKSFTKNFFRAIINAGRLLAKVFTKNFLTSAHLKIIYPLNFLKEFIRVSTKMAAKKKKGGAKKKRA